MLRFRVRLTFRLRLWLEAGLRLTPRVRFRLRLAGGRVDAAITTLDKKDCEGHVW